MYNIDDYERADRIIDFVKQKFRLEDINRARTAKSQRLSDARAVCCFLLREHTGLSHAEIADFIGFADHTSSISATRTVVRNEKLMELASHFHMKPRNFHRIYA